MSIRLIIERTSKVFLSIALAGVFLAGSAAAEKLCVKGSISKGKVKFGTKTVASSAKCPKGYSALVDNSTFTGPGGATGATGVDGQLRVYGNGSAGAKTVSADEHLGSALAVHEALNLQYTDFTVDSGKTLTVPSGTVIRCTGTFTNNGTIVVNAGTYGANARGLFTNNDYEEARAPAHPGISGRGAGDGSWTNLPSGSGDVLGGAGGLGLDSVQAAFLLKPGSFGGGAGAAGGPSVLTLSAFPPVVLDVNWGSSGGGSFVVVAKNGIVNKGAISANGSTGFGGGGGGGGGVVILASQTSVSAAVGSAIEAKGGAGQNAVGFHIADLSVGDVGAVGAGGGGGGGIVHLIAPTVSSNGTITVTGGAKGSTSGVTAGSAMRFGGGGGGACGGTGGQGGSISAAGAALEASAGNDGVYFVNQVDPTSLL
jgi:hypothetical protein